MAVPSACVIEHWHGGRIVQRGFDMGKIFASCRGHCYGGTCQGSLYPLLELTTQTCSSHGLNPWPRALHASTLARSYLHSLLINFRNIYI
jgi:hypothetical protein